MEISQQFALKVKSISNNRAALIALIEEIDLQKRNLRAQQQKFSSLNKERTGISGVGRFDVLRRLKLKMEHLKTEREYAKNALGVLNANQKSLSRAVHQKPSFNAAFVAAAERSLPAEQFLELECKACEIALAEF